MKSKQFSGSLGHKNARLSRVPDPESAQDPDVYSRNLSEFNCRQFCHRIRTNIANNKLQLYTIFAKESGVSHERGMKQGYRRGEGALHRIPIWHRKGGQGRPRAERFWEMPRRPEPHPRRFRIT